MSAVAERRRAVSAGGCGDGLNLYTYLGSNPWGRHDPLGLQWDPFDMVDDFLAESLGNRLATLSAIGQDSKAAGVVMATIASYLPFPAASIMGEAALRALGESTDSEMAMAMALAAVPGGKLAAVLGKATGAMWRGAVHYARIGGGAILNRGSGLMRKAKDFLRRKPPSACGCFIAGTLLWTAHGMVPIEEVRVGDFVIAKDEASGALVLREVTGEIVVKQAALLDVALKQDGHETTLRTTDEHPFWVTGRGWTRADSLVPGDEVDTFGSTATVLALSFTGERTTVYNISVDGNPNYFVGPDGVWVHNCGFEQLFKIKFGHFRHRKGWDKILGKSNPSDREIAGVLEEVVSANLGTLKPNGVTDIVGKYGGHDVYVQVYSRAKGLYEITSAGLRSLK